MYSDKDAAYEYEVKRDSQIREAKELKKYLLVTCAALSALDALETFKEIHKWYQKHLEEEAQEQQEEEQHRKKKLTDIRLKIKELEAEEQQLKEPKYARKRKM